MAVLSLASVLKWRTPELTPIPTVHSDKTGS